MLTDDTPPLNFREAKKKKAKRPWKIEMRWPSSQIGAWNNWSKFASYETEKRRDQALIDLNRSWSTKTRTCEFRKVDTERKTK
jgi:hypothetical protein